MIKELLSKILTMVFGKYLPCYIISHKPFIIISYWQDFISNKEKFIKNFAGHEKVFIIFQLGWHRETDERVMEIVNALKELNTMRPGLEYIFLCNSTREEELFKQYSLNGILCHQNAFIDERKYKIIPLAVKKYAAIYIARVTPFKRHELAAGIDSLRLIGYYSPTETQYFQKIMQLLKHPDWTLNVSSGRIYKEINSASTGLCLSAEEGAMFVSAEYLLCGIPIVNTKNLGGRDTLFSPEYVFSAENTPESVAEGVKTLIAKKLPPEK
ncbi:MAG: hypothetical protein WC071_09395, partial [Victivallaceae bacterium]